MNSFLFFATLFCAIGVSTSLWGPRTTKGQKRDCRWMHWSSAGRCEKAGSSKFHRIRQRVKVPERNGGKKCVGPSVTHLPCTAIQYRAGTFLKTVNSVGEGEAPQQVFGIMAPEPSLCWNSTSGKAYECRRRRAVGSIQSYEDEVKARTKRQAPSFNHRDVLFVLDESGSVYKENFKKELRMTRAIVNNWCGAIAVGEKKTRVGIMSFDRDQHDQLNFKLKDSLQVSKHIDNNIEYTGESSGETCLYDALEYARTSMFHKDRGARINDPGVEKLVVLFTDGCPECTKWNAGLKKMASTFEQDKISIIVYVIGNIHKCEATMETMLEGTRCKELFKVQNWEEFDEMIEEIEKIDLDDCTDAWSVIGEDCPYAEKNTV